VGKGKKHTPEQILSLLRQIEVAVANGKTTPVACRSTFAPTMALSSSPGIYASGSPARSQNGLHRARESMGKRLLRELQPEAAG
jgi:hypothetical protein